MSKATVLKLACTGRLVKTRATDAKLRVSDRVGMGCSRGVYISHNVLDDVVSLKGTFENHCGGLLFMAA